MYILFFISIFCLIASITLFVINIYKKKKLVSKNQEQFSEKLTKENLELLQIQAELKKEVDILSQNKMLLADEQDRLTKLLKKYREDGYESVNREVQKQRQIEEQRIAHENSVREHELIKIYWKKKSDLEAEYDELKQRYQQQLDEQCVQIAEWQTKLDAINEQIRKEEEIKKGIDIHHICLSDNDKNDINYLISIESNIHNKELLYKLIWSEYLQKPFNQMINNLFGTNIPKNVVYCIENITSHKKYIGKTSTEVSKRWTEHIKSSLGIGGIKTQLIHQALFKHWDEFTFFVLEEVKNGSLAEREKFYINMYQTNIYGFNLKKGG